MKFLANENFPVSSIKLIRAKGFDTRAIIEEKRGIPDTEVLSLANLESRIILTFDRDYGELIYHYGLSSVSGIVYFKFIPDYPDEPAEIFLKTIEIPNIVFINKFTVLEKDRIRQRNIN